jgi:CubicO group peptidase (beta-lactamase class C family)
MLVSHFRPAALAALGAALRAALGATLRVTLGVALGVALAATSPAAGTAAGARDSLQRYAAGLAAFGFTGQLVVAEGDSLLLSRSCGTADAKGRPVSYATGFAAGSITKSVTAALVVALAGRGVLSLDEPLARHLPGVPADKVGITLRQLLTHTSGLPMDAEGVYALDAREAVLRATLTEPLVAAPGARFGYSNAGFQLLAAVCENATGVPLPRLADSLLFAPLGMRDTGLGAAYARSVGDWADGRNEWQVLPGFHGWRQAWAGSGAGDLVTTARDLWRWARALQGDGPLSRAALDTLLARRVAAGNGLSYGFGVWRPASAAGGEIVSLGGDIPGYHALVWFDSKPGGRIVAVASAGERWGRGLPTQRAARTLWDLAAGRARPLPPETANWPADRVRALAGEWRVAPDGRLALVPEGLGLRAELAGETCVTLVCGADSTGSRALAEGRASDILRAAIAADDTALAAALLPPEREAWTPVLRDEIAKAVKATGRIRSIAIDGTVPLPWIEGGQRTYVRLTGPRGECDASLAWLSGGLLDVAFGEGRPAPVILPVAPALEGGLVGWDMLTGATLRLAPYAGPKGEPRLRLTGAGGREATARRAR